MRAKRVLAISSQVVRGHVGNSAAVFALQRLGHEVWPLPTVLLSNHPGHPKVAAMRLPPAQLAAMMDALGDNGWLAEVDAVMTGYLPTADHVALAAATIERLRALGNELLVLVDPVLGDDPRGLYIDVAAAIALRQRLVPHADILTPNRFELSWLSECPVTGAVDARAAAMRLDVPAVVATSVPGSTPATLLNLLCHIGETHTAAVRRRAAVPHGTGDLLAALLLGQRLLGQALPDALDLAVEAVEAAVAASEGADELLLAPSQQAWGQRPPGIAG